MSSILSIICAKFFQFGYNFVPEPDLSFVNFTWIFKVLFFVIIFGYIFFAFLLTFRVRILADTVNTPFNKVVRAYSVIHLVIALIGGILVLAIILLA